MDSLTHIVVGAAVGDLMLGKKIGNRAMVWGALAGSVPDFDVFANFFTDDLGGLEVHRGLTHSWFFMLFGSLLLAWLERRWYRGGWRLTKGYPWLRGAVFLLLYVLLVALVSGVTGFLAGWYALIPVSLGLGIGWMVFRNVYFNQIIGFEDHAQEPGQVSFRSWYLLFGLGILTHIVLDCATAYGTQIWLPFSNQRVSWGNMAVVDILFSLPMVISVPIAAALPRRSMLRKVLLISGLSISALYWGNTLVRRDKVEAIWQKTLVAMQIPANRHFIAPTLMNNIVWHGVAVAADSIYVGDYAFTDSRPEFRITGRYSYWVNPPPDLNGSRAWRILTWFSKGFYRWEEEGIGYSFTDLRFGGISAESDDDGVFKFHLVRDASDAWHVAGGREGSEQDIREGLRRLWVRMQGLP